MKHDFGNLDKFSRDMLRERMELEVTADLEFLKSTQAAALSSPSEQEIAFIIQTQKQVRRELSRN